MTSLFLKIRKTNRAHFGCFEDNGWGGGRQSEKCLEKTNEEHYFFLTIPKLYIFRNIIVAID